MARELFEDKSRAMMASSSSMGFVYSGSDPDSIQIQPENIFNLTTGMEMIGFSKNHQPPPDTWKAFFAKGGSSAGPSSSPKTLTHPNNTNESSSSGGFYQSFGSSNVNVNDLMDQSGAVSWQSGGHVDDSSLRCVFPCEGNERPSQGLSLSLSSTNPSGIGLQSFELRQTQNDTDHMRFRNNFSDQVMAMHNSFNLRSSKYLGPAQDLLNEFCSLETTSQHQANKRNHHQKNKLLLESDHNIVDHNNGNGSSSSSSTNKLQSLDVIELQKRKAKLLSMLEEVDRRYRHYSDQMKGVESVLESAAGAGSATVYSALASKAMSRHFRCLRDGIVGQIQATKKAIGEKDPVAPGASRGETPRLRVLDQTLRQQRAFQQMTMMESHPWRPQRGLPERSVSVLRAWLFEHFLHPYPSDVDKHILARQTGLSRSQVSNWFINARVRLWKPMVEEMYVEETKEQDNLNNNMGGAGGSSDGVTTTDPDDTSGRPNHHHEDHKPTPAQLVRIDSECLSSIISNPDKDSSSKNHNNNMNNIINHNNNYGHNTTSYGAPMELDFASYNQNVNTVSFHQDSAAANNNINFNGTGVSLTLGLQQHGNNNGSGVSLAFYNPRSTVHHDHHHDEMEPVVQYNMMDGEGQNLPYRNLMGAQLLHDLAG